MGMGSTKIRNDNDKSSESLKRLWPCETTDIVTRRVTSSVALRELQRKASTVHEGARAVLFDRDWRAPCSETRQHRTKVTQSRSLGSQLHLHYTHLVSGIVWSTVLETTGDFKSIGKPSIVGFKGSFKKCAHNFIQSRLARCLHLLTKSLVRIYLTE